MKVLVCGDRNWTKLSPIILQLQDLPKDTIIIHGACKGADSLGGYVARKLGLGVKEYPAQWNIYGKGAGPIRNRQMITEEPDIELVLAFHEHIEDSKGTKDMLAVAEAAGIKTKLISE